MVLITGIWVLPCHHFIHVLSLSSFVCTYMTHGLQQQPWTWSFHGTAANIIFGISVLSYLHSSLLVTEGTVLLISIHQINALQCYQWPKVCKWMSQYCDHFSSKKNLGLMLVKERMTFYLELVYKYANISKSPALGPRPIASGNWMTQIKWSIAMVTCVP